MIHCFIPARLESTRMERKLTRKDTGQCLFEHTVDAVVSTRLFERVIVATDSEFILRVARSRGDCQAVFTGPARSGSDRIAEAVTRCNSGEHCVGRYYQPIADGDLIVNVQADEPEIRASHLETLIKAATRLPACDMATLAAPLKLEEWHKPNVVKVVRGVGGDAVKFSRKMMPNAYHHLGIYAYTVRFLRWYTGLKQTVSEELEGLEQLRALEHGARIRVALVREAWPGIDTEEEYQAFVERRRESQCPTT